MGVYDQAARYATQAHPRVVVSRLLRPSGRVLDFREWLDTRTLPLPGGPDRIADLVAALDDPAAADRPWLLVLEFQAQEDPDKLEATLVEASVLRAYARRGPERRGRYCVLCGLVYLRGRCPNGVLDMTVPGGYGTRHAPLVWDIDADDAFAALATVAADPSSWGLLFWVPLMAGGGEDAVVSRWREVVEAVVSDLRMRGNLAAVALVFAELVGRRIEWKRGLEGFEMTESQVVNEWISQGEARGELKNQRQNLLDLLESAFPGAIPQDVVRLIQHQDSLEVLRDWFKAALRAKTPEQFLGVLKR